MATVLNINGLTKSYAKVKALNNLNLQINQGEVFGILGPNGSGKTTTLGILLSVLNADSGSFSWNEQEPSKFDRKKIGSLLEELENLNKEGAQLDQKILEIIDKVYE